MAEQKHLEDLQAVRDRLVDLRRTSAATAATSKENFGSWWPDVIKCQAAIEAIDRAIADESKLAKPGYNLDNIV